MVAVKRQSTVFMGELLTSGCQIICWRCMGGACFSATFPGGASCVGHSPSGEYRFALIDTGRIHAYDCPRPLHKRVAGLVRICNKMNRSGHQRFLNTYMAALRHRISWWDLFAFSLYDFKVVAKRSLCRKAIKRLLRSISHR